MKLVATRIQSPLEQKALHLYNKEFGQGDSGLVLFPERSIKEQDLKTIFNISNKYNIGIAGTIDEEKYQKAILISNGILHVGSISFPGEFIPNVNPYNPNKSIQHNSPLRTFYDEDKILNVSIGTEHIDVLFRICSDVLLPYVKHEKSDLLLIPSSIEHPTDWFKHHVHDFKRNLKDNAKIVYSSIETNNGFTNHPMGIYNINFEPLGEEEENYVILETN